MQRAASESAKQTAASGGLMAATASATPRQQLLDAADDENFKGEALNERTSAACAMEWSIDLEKGLRSKKPGNSHEAILQIMHRLELWDKEPAVTKAQCRIFRLVPGEDRLFANTILLRLADAFSSGDEQIKHYVVKVFMSLMKNHKRGWRINDGILFKCSLENRLELLRQVKVVFDTGDVKLRALALVLFGCLADVARDNADVRYLVLSSLVSNDTLQVEASLFAGGCFCKLSDDFASVFLEILVNLVTSSEVSANVRVAGARAFAKMKYSSLHACKAYKAILKLISDSREEEFLRMMLISLSKLASRWSHLIPEQVSLLFSFLTKENSVALQAVALKCLHYISAKGMSHFPSHVVSIQTLFRMLDESKYPPALQCGALQMLRKVSSYNFTRNDFMDMLELSKIFKIIENAAKSPIIAKRRIAICFLIDILGKLSVTKEKVLDGISLNALASAAISLLAPDGQKIDLEMEGMIKGLIVHLFEIVKRCPDLGAMVLERFCLLMENVVNNCEVVGTVDGDLTGSEIMEFTGQDGKSITCKLSTHLFRIMDSFLENLNETDFISMQVLDRVELIVNQLLKCSSFDFFTRVIHSFLLHSRITSCHRSCERDESDNHNGNSSTTVQGWLVRGENFSLECAKKILATNNNWWFYKLGRHAACQGAWSTAAFIFEHLGGIVLSDIHDKWVESLIRFAHSERSIQLLKLPEGGPHLLCQSEINFEILTKACISLRSSGEMMAAFAKLGCPGLFQRWFLDLRAKILESVAKTLSLFSYSLLHDNVDTDGYIEDSVFTSLAGSLVQISLQFNTLAREFGLIVTAFMDMDIRSLEIIREMALSCSLLAFGTGFSLFFPYQDCESCIKISDDYLHGILIQDLGWRLQQRDYEISSKLGLLLRVCKPPVSFLLHSRNQMRSNRCEVIGLLAACSYSVSQVIILQDATEGVHEKGKIRIQAIRKRLQLLWDIIAKCMRIPFQTPNYFFRIRPCISSELFALTSDTRCSNGASVLQGSQLILDLCLQLKNTPMDFQTQSAKLYCVLYCKKSFQVPRTGGKSGDQRQLDFQDLEIDDMVNLNDRLFQYVKGSTCATSNHGVTETFVHFEPNEKGQGFSTCLLNMSGFPLGTYKTQWFSCCVDSEGSYWSLLPLNAGPVITVVRIYPKS